MWKSSADDSRALRLENRGHLAPSQPRTNARNLPVAGEIDVAEPGHVDEDALLADAGPARVGRMTATANRKLDGMARDDLDGLRDLLGRRGAYDAEGLLNTRSGPSGKSVSLVSRQGGRGGMPPHHFSSTTVWLRGFRSTAATPRTLCAAWQANSRSILERFAR